MFMTDHLQLVTLFGSLIDLAGTTEVYLRGSTVAELRNHFIQQFPEAARYTWTVAVNHHWAKEDQALVSGDEIVFLPPFSGG
jgi:molybdopterin converting factor small subunit